MQQEVYIRKRIISLCSREILRPRYKTIGVKLGPEILLNVKSLLTLYKLQLETPAASITRREAK